MTDETIFAAALEKPDPAERSAFLAEACGNDAELRRRVEGLLAAHEKADTFLERPAVSMPDPDAAATRAFSPTSDTDATRTGTAGTPRPDADPDDEAIGFLSPPRRPDSLGRLGHYEILQVLGRGGFGIVFRAFDDVLQRVVAVKVLAPQMAATSPARKRFLREARSGAQIHHENVVQIHATEEQPLPYLVMEFVSGETLQQRLDRNGPLEVPEVLRIGRQIAEGLAAAHGNGLIHRDVKPANVLLDGGPQERVKLTDFGLARAADDASISQSGVVAGTPMYMAPEQARGDTLDHRADLFSLGSVLYAMLTGRPPFRATTTLAVLKRVAEDDPRPIREVIPEVPEWLCRVVEKLHAKNPDERFQTAREVADLLTDAEHQLKAHGALKDFSRIPGGKPTAKWRRQRRIALAAAAVACAAVAAAGVWRVSRQGWENTVHYVANRATVRIDVRNPNVESVAIWRDDVEVETLGSGQAVRTWPAGQYAVVVTTKPGFVANRMTVQVGGYGPGGRWQRTREGGDRFELPVLRGGAYEIVEIGTVAVPPPPATGSADGLVSLFNGKDLTGWKTHPDQPGNWTVKDGVLTGGGPRSSHLFTERGDFENFELRVEFKVNEKGNSGVFFRSPFALPKTSGGRAYPDAPEVQINYGGTDAIKTGSLYGIRNVTEWHGRPDRWNILDLIVEGDRITVKINGFEIVNHRETDPKRPRRGHIALQEIGPETAIQFRRIEIKELPATSPAAPSPAVPTKAADVLPFLAGTWKVETQNRDPQAPPDKGSNVGHFTFDFVAGGKFLHGRTSRGQFVDLWSFVPGNNALGRWIARSNGWTSPGPVTGLFNPDNRTLTMGIRIGGIDSVHEYAFIDSNTCHHRFFSRDASGTPTGEVRQKWTRVPGPVTMPALPPDPKWPDQMAVLDRLVGEWRNEITVTAAATPDKPTTEVVRMTAAPILGGRFVEVIETNETKKTSDYTLAWFDPEAKRYRQWFFHGDGYVLEFAGTWDEAAKTLTWTSPDGALEGTWVFTGDDLRDVRHTVKDKAGKTVMTMNGVSRRVAPARPREVPRTAADVLSYLAGTWKIEGQKLDSKLPPDDVLTDGHLVYDFVAGGKFLRGRGSLGEGRNEPLFIYTVDPGTNGLRMWQAWSGGTTTGTISGTFIADSRTLMFNHRIGSTDSVHQFIFTDANTYTHRYYHKDAGGTITRERSNKHTRVPGPVTIPSSPADPKRPAQMTVLDRLVGDWRCELTHTTADAPDEPTVEVVRKKVTPILGGRFIELSENSETKKSDEYTLCWFDGFTYRAWRFAADGRTWTYTGTWDDATKTLTWVTSEKSSGTRWTFKGDDEYEVRGTITDGDGKTIRTMTGTARRVVPAPLPKKADKK